MIAHKKYRHLLSNTLLVFSAGFAMFSMFFGSGNLVFPLMIGKVVGAQYGPAIVGLILTAVLIPFLGLFAILLYQGSYKLFFARFDRVTAFVVPLLILSLIGPFGVIPRCITVSHGSLSLIFPDFPLWGTSLVFCGLLFLLTLDHKKIVPILGNALTPFLMIALALIVYYGIKQGAAPKPYHSAADALTLGALEGYQTMDLMATFFFATSIMGFLKQRLQNTTQSARARNMIMFASLCVGALLLAIIYGFLVYLGASFTDILSPKTMEKSIAIIAFATLGPNAGPIVTTAVVLACLTTGVVLTVVSAEFYQEKVFRGKFGMKRVNLFILIISFAVSNLEFEGIKQILAPILKTIYPSVIMFTLLNISYKLMGTKALKLPVLLVLLATVFVVYIWPNISQVGMC